MSDLYPSDGLSHEVKRHPGLLEKELETLAQKREELLTQGEGKFVLVKESTLVGIFSTQLDAISAGYLRFGNVPFLVRQILKQENPISFDSGIDGI